MLSVTTGSSAKIKRSNGRAVAVAGRGGDAQRARRRQDADQPGDRRQCLWWFRYATGSIGKGGSCVYAWQFARNINPYDGGRLGAAAAAQIRMRYCSPALVADRIVG